MQGHPPLLSDDDLAWVVNPLANITPQSLLPGYSHVQVGDRELLHQVFWGSCACIPIEDYHHQAISLPQLTREQGWLIYVLSTGQFSMRGARGCLTNMRVLELRNAREAGHTGNVASYNFLASLLPQDTRVFFQR